MVSNYQLQESASSAAADSTGKAIARLRPLRAFETWNIVGISITNTSSTKIPTFKLYRGSEAPSNLINGTYKGGLNSDPTFTYQLQNGEALVGVWENGDVGAVGTMTIGGTREGR